MIVITGGAGFIGSNLVALLEQRGYGKLVVCDRLGHDEKWRNLAKRELADLVAPEALLPWLDAHAHEVEAIVHLGAISSTTETDADLTIETNFRLSLALWDWCTANAVRFLYASSAATYGDGAAGFVDDPAPDALAKLRPLNVYGWSKHLFDRKVARILAEDGPTPPQWAGLKFFNVYGPNEYHKQGQMSVVAKIWPDIEAGRPVQLFKSHREDYADGGQLRDFVWVGNCAAVIRWLLDTPDVSGLFNLGTGQARSFADLARAAIAAAGGQSEITYIDMPETLRPKYQYFTQADMSRLRTAGFTPEFTSLEDGVGRYVREFLAADDPYR